MVPRAFDAHIRQRAASIHRVRFERVDRRCSVFARIAFCVEALVAFSRYINRRRAWWHVAERAGEGSGSSAPAIC